MLLPLKSEHIDCNEFDLQVVHVIPATPVSAHGPSLTTTHASVIDLVLSIEKSFSAFDASRLTNSAAFRAAARDGRWAIWNAMRAEFGLIIGRFTYRSGFFHLDEQVTHGGVVAAITNPAPWLLGRWRGRRLLGRLRSRGLLERWRGKSRVDLIVQFTRRGVEFVAQRGDCSLKFAARLFVCLLSNLIQRLADRLPGFDF